MKARGEGWDLTDTIGPDHTAPKGVSDVSFGDNFILLFSELFRGAVSPVIRQFSSSQQLFGEIVVRNDFVFLQQECSTATFSKQLHTLPIT